MSALYTDLNNGILTLTVNRPPVNAFNLALITELQLAFQRAAGDSTVRVIILTGHGRTFSAGQDVTEFSPGSQVSYRAHLQRSYNPLILQIRQIEKPVIAAVNGHAAGASLGVALACDLRLASDTARFVLGFSGLGLAPDSGVSLLLPALVGLGRAAELTFSSAPLRADQALAWGLVNRVVRPEDLHAETGALAAELASGPVGAYGLAKRAYNRAVLPDLERVLDYEAHLQEIAGRRAEHQEGVAAFLEKRTPRFQ